MWAGTACPVWCGWRVSARERGRGGVTSICGKAMAPTDGVVYKRALSMRATTHSWSIASATRCLSAACFGHDCCAVMACTKATLRQLTTVKALPPLRVGS